MKDSQKNNNNYIQELEDKILDLSFQLNNKKNELIELKTTHYNRIRKLIHNLKNPIGVAYSFSEILMENPSELNSEKSKKYLEVIQNSTHFSIETLNGLAEINRLNSPSYQLNLTSTNYIELVLNCIQKFTKEAESKNIILIKNFPKNPLFLTISIQEIEKLIEILVHNALRYSPKNSTIKITINETEAAVETCILDEGIGIDEKDFLTIFNEFSVIQTYSNSNTKCVGLGLAIAQKIIQLHQGSISVKSSLGNGAEFKISIPKKYN